MINNKGQVVFIGVIILAMAIMIFILSAPAIFESIGIGTSTTGSATSFFMKLIPWIMIIFVVIIFIRVITSGSG